jgi:hypothetical protein
MAVSLSRLDSDKESGQEVTMANVGRGGLAEHG